MIISEQIGIKVFSWFIPMEEVTPQPEDILCFGDVAAVVVEWNEKCIRLQSLQSDYVDRGWLARFLERIKLIRPEFKPREINFREKAYLVGSVFKEC